MSIPIIENEPESLGKNKNRFSNIPYSGPQPKLTSNVKDASGNIV